MDDHTAQTVWLTASGHLLDRVLDEGPQVLRLLEDGPALQQRSRYARELADAVPMSFMRGRPQAIAASVERLATCAEVHQ